MMKRILVMTFCLLAAPAFAAGEASESKKEQKDSASHPAVQSWMDLQRSGAQASSVPQTLTPVIQERVVKRYLDSFNAPIPVFFTDESSMGTSTAAVSR